MAKTHQSADHATRGSRRSHAPSFRLRTGFTLVELLIVIAILAILASMVLFALAGAEGSAKVMRTRTTIDKLHNIIMQKYESYRTRRVPVNPRAIAATYTNLKYMDAFALARLNSLRELMLLEMPDDFEDIYVRSGTVLNPRLRKFLPAAPSASQSYLNFLRKADQAARAKGLNIEDDNINEECLYLFIARGTDEIDVLEQFSSSEIGDTDGDGLFEFIDAWGKPIKWLRWAPAYNSPLQQWDLAAAIPEPSGSDPFDPLNVDERIPAAANVTNPVIHPMNTFPLTPLIYSAGADGEFGVIAEGGLPYAATDNNPFEASKRGLIGLRDDSLSVDNVTNHEVEYEPSN